MGYFKLSLEELCLNFDFFQIVSMANMSYLSEVSNLI